MKPLLLSVILIMATIIFVNCTGQPPPAQEPPRDYTAQLAEAKAFCIKKN
jgi:hypothetical protein